MGTVDYMSPEQAFNTKQADGRADIYSLGCTLYYLLTAKPVFDGETIMERLLGHREKPIPSARDLRAEVPEEVDGVLRKMLAKTPEDRYQSMTEVIADLQGCGVGAGSTVGGRSQSATDLASSNSNLTFLREATAGQTVQRKTTRQIKQSQSDDFGGFKKKQFALIGGGVLGVVVLLAAIVVSLRTKDGTLIVEVDQPDVTVQVLDSQGKVEVSQKGGAGKVTISVDPGKHRLRVEKDGFAIFGQEFEMEEGGKKAITAKLEAVKATAAGEPSKTWNTQAFQSWMKSVAALPAKEHVKAVVTKLQELNPEYDGQETHRVENNVVTEFSLEAANVTDISPVRALSGLKVLNCSGRIGHGQASKLSDLSPLKGMPLTTLRCSITQVSDLSPLENCTNLQSLNLEATRVTAASVASLQKALPNCKITWFMPTRKTPILQVPLSPTPPLAKAPFDAAQAKAHQQAWAKHLGIEVETPNSVGMKMVLIPPGEFLMGSTDEQVAEALKIAEEIKADVEVKGKIREAERPQHKVTITKPFRMSATEVTVGQFKKFTASGYVTEAEAASRKTSSQSAAANQASAAASEPILTYLNPGFTVTDDLPASYITWADAIAYCKWLSTQEKTNYRLPTEAEWEYACRSGTTTQYSFGDDVTLLGQYAWYSKNATNNPLHPVGTKLPNGFGLFDMHGNVNEWCSDFYGDKWYSASPQNDPIGPVGSNRRIIRSGNGHSKGNASYCRSATRQDSDSSWRGSNHGFRCVTVLELPTTTPPASSTKLFMHDPAFPQWMAQVQAMPAEQQIEAVRTKLMDLNPGFDGVVRGGIGGATPKIEDGVVTEYGFYTANVTDISPVRALSGLKSLSCSGARRPQTVESVSFIRNAIVETGLSVQHAVVRSFTVERDAADKAVLLRYAGFRFVAATELQRPAKYSCWLRHRRPSRRPPKSPPQLQDRVGRSGQSDNASARPFRYEVAFETAQDRLLI